MASKKDIERNKALLADKGINLNIDAEPGIVNENIDEVIAKVRALLDATKEIPFDVGSSEVEAAEVIATRDTVKAAKAETERIVKAAKTEYDLPFTVIDAKVKALDINLEKRLTVLDSIATIIENADGTSPEVTRRNDIYAYWQKKAAWLGAKYGPMVWAEHPKAWESQTKKLETVYDLIDELLEYIRTGFRMIKLLHSPFEELLLERYCECCDLSNALGVVYGYNEYLIGVAEVAANGYTGSRFDWGALNLEVGERDTQDIAVTGDPAQIKAAMEVIASFGITITGTAPRKSEALMEYLARKGFDDKQVAEILQDMRSLGMSASKVMTLPITSEMTSAEIEEVFFRDILN